MQAIYQTGLSRTNTQLTAVIVYNGEWLMPASKFSGRVVEWSSVRAYRDALLALANGPVVP
jgi:hypothetical protein